MKEVAAVELKRTEQPAVETRAPHDHAFRRDGNLTASAIHMNRYGERLRLASAARKLARAEAEVGTQSGQRDLEHLGVLEYRLPAAASLLPRSSAIRSASLSLPAK